jgi:xylulokinase
LARRCLAHLLNSPANFTASKLRWVRVNEPEVFGRIHKFLLPGDYFAFRLTRLLATTLSGLSRGIFWDFAVKSVSRTSCFVTTRSERTFFPRSSPPSGSRDD